MNERQAEMWVFLSYAAEDREVAEQVHLALTGAGYHVFFDRDSLPPADDYHARIRSAVDQSEIFVFLISPRSVATGSYALTELKYARAKWPHPKTRVLPVLSSSTDWNLIPNYLKAVTLLEPEGNVAAETAAAVAALRENLNQAQAVPQRSTTRHSTPILVAIISAACVVGAAVIANWDKIFPDKSVNQTRQMGGEQQLTTPPSSVGYGYQRSVISGCFEQYFSGLPKDRIAIVEAGAKDFQLIGPHQPKDQTVAIQLQENRQPVGAIKFQFYLENSIFKIESLVNTKCQAVEDYVNASRGGDKHTLQNWDDLQVRLGNATYTLTLEYGAGRIDADFVRISPER